MPSINHGTSIYHHVAGMYLRDESGTLLLAEGRYAEQMRIRWSDIRQRISETKPLPTALPSGKNVNTVHIILPFTLKGESPDQPQPFQIHEFQESNGTTTRGLLLLEPSDNTNTDTYNWAKTFLLLNTRFLTTNHSFSSSLDPESQELAERIADLFEESLKNTSQDDAWLTGGGRRYFVNKTYPFIKDKKRIQLCLPAFPCKSSNSLKVAGKEPDAAEYLALRHLHRFIEQVCEIYPHGATLWIISDGHVFSDCIGVDDAIVDSYGQTLSTTYRLKTAHANTKDLIQFTGLEDLFFSDTDSRAAFSSSMLQSVSIPQPIETIRTESAQECRLLLEQIGGIDRAHLRALITQKDPETMKLYQGQSKFMLEDLSTHLGNLGVGNKQKKKIASCVAAEMIARNHAYSNLVELLFPHHIRLSIHAHKNSGPKFGIRLFPNGTVRPAQTAQSFLSASASDERPEYEFQIPTPWHNSLVKIEGSDIVLLTRAEFANDAIGTEVDNRKFEGCWCDDGVGGYFALRRVKEEASGPATKESTVATMTVPPAKSASVSEMLRRRWMILGTLVWDGIRGFWSAVRAAIWK
ncbi:Pyoverdine/dityrosine biosynthesis protein-domain-containing protein [Aspergillus granulosus]|uniref:Pyoverdine/dityrosine biosynthesis protein-domain-containing protein n=1 Tax=Aspergillus granulosus TaxID=176169 RepID=A0ABR4GYG9_9EURO